MINERIKELRLARALSQVELAKRLSVSKQCVSNWENGYIQPSIDMLIKLAGMFSVSADYLLGIDNRRFLEAEKLNDAQLSHIQAIIDDIRGRRFS